MRSDVWWGVRSGVGVLIGSLVVAACSSEQVTSNTAPTETLPAATTTAPAPTTVSPPSAPPSTTPPTGAPTSPPPTTAAAPTTVAPPTTARPPEAWVLTDLFAGAAVQGYSGNWCCDDARSPAWPDDPAAPLADGFYAATLTQPWAPGDTVLHVRVQRLDPCTELPADTCNLNDDPHEMGLDPNGVREFEVPLDASTAVVVTGFDCPSNDPVDRQNKLGTGAGLRQLWESYTADYAAVIAPLVAAGADLYADPQPFGGGSGDGFITEADTCPPEMVGAGPLRYVRGDAPMLLLQTVTDEAGESLDAHELVRLSGAWYLAGTPTFMFYAGFYS